MKVLMSLMVIMVSSVALAKESIHCRNATDLDFSIGEQGNGKVAKVNYSGEVYLNDLELRSKADDVYSNKEYTLSFDKKTILDMEKKSGNNLAGPWETVTTTFHAKVQIKRNDGRPVSDDQDCGGSLETISAWIICAKITQ